MLEYNGEYYDWSGIVEVSPDDVVFWDTYCHKDRIHTERITKECVL